MSYNGLYTYVQAGVQGEMTPPLPSQQLPQYADGFVGDAKDTRDVVDRFLNQYGSGDVPLTTLYMLVFSAALRVAGKTLAGALKELNDNSKELDKLTRDLADLNKLKAQQGTAKSSDTIPDSDELRKVLDILQEDGISIKKPGTTWGDLDGATAELKAVVDSKTNLSQQYQLSIQNKQSFLANVNDAGSNGLSKMWTALQTIVGNFR